MPMPKKEEILIRKADGSVIGPYGEMFAGHTIFLLDQGADVESGDAILRNLPSGKQQPHYVKEANFYSESINNFGPHFQVKFSMQPPQDTSNESKAQRITISNAHSVQIGDHNIQNIRSVINLLEKAIEKSNAPAVEREEAKSLLNSFLRHPLVVTLAGKLF